MKAVLPTTPVSEPYWSYLQRDELWLPGVNRARGWYSTRGKSALTVQAWSLPGNRCQARGRFTPIQ